MGFIHVPPPVVSSGGGIATAGPGIRVSGDVVRTAGLIATVAQLQLYGHPAPLTVKDWVTQATVEYAEGGTPAVTTRQLEPGAQYVIESCTGSEGLPVVVKALSPYSLYPEAYLASYGANQILIGPWTRGTYDPATQTFVPLLINTLTAPDSSQWRIVVANDGTLSTETASGH